MIQVGYRRREIDRRVLPFNTPENVRILEMGVSTVTTEVSRRGENNSLADVEIVQSGFLGSTYNFTLYLDPVFSHLVAVEPGRVTFTGHGDIRAIYLNLLMPDLGLRKEVGSGDFQEIQAKLDTTLISWSKKLEAELQKRTKEKNREIARERTEEASKQRDRLIGILAKHLSLSRTRTIEDIAPKAIVKAEGFSEPKPQKPDYPPEPVYTEPTWKPPKISALQKIAGQAKTILQNAETEYEQAVLKAKKSYQNELATRESEVALIDKNYAKDITLWETRKKRHEREVNRQKALATEAQESFEVRKKAWRNHDKGTVEYFSTRLLNLLSEDEFLHEDFDLEYRPDEKLLVVEFALPEPSEIPDLKACRYVISEDEFRETKISQADRKRLYETTCYQTALLIVDALFSLDDANNFDSIAFNGIASYNDPATGKLTQSVILSAIFPKDEFLLVDLDHVDPKQCFKRFKGVAASSLMGLTPVAPIVPVQKDDRRFVEAKENLSGVAQGRNIAAMHWEDFEHLIREVFEKEFSTRGAEVKVTQASSDGGIDAVVFDPDPIMGGKTVIQAKRYTNIVGVSAVRDLYGTVLNEGASKGILVTTSDYGPDAYKFASDKPLTLLNGSNLLHLLEKQGIKASIDISEARKVLGLG